MSILGKYVEQANNPSDINEHLPTLREYANQCETILELGVRGCVSSWAFAQGLLENGKQTKHLFCNDLTPCDIKDLIAKCRTNGIDIKYKWCSDLDPAFQPGTFDLIFIDTLHVYGQLKRELTKFAPLSRKYIVLHDTTSDGIKGEAIRLGMNVNELSKQTKIPQNEITKGLWPAVTEFVQQNPEWTVHKRYTNNNGLTILKRINPLVNNSSVPNGSHPTRCSICLLAVLFLFLWVIFSKP